MIEAMDRRDIPEVERLQGGEAFKGREVGDLRAPEVERLQGGEALERAEVVHAFRA